MTWLPTFGMVLAILCMIMAATTLYMHAFVSFADDAWVAGLVRLAGALLLWAFLITEAVLWIGKFLASFRPVS